MHRSLVPFALPWPVAVGILNFCSPIPAFVLLPIKAYGFNVNALTQPSLTIYVVNHLCVSLAPNKMKSKRKENIRFGKVSHICMWQFCLNELNRFSVRIKWESKCSHGARHRTMWWIVCVPLSMLLFSEMKNRKLSPVFVHRNLNVQPTHWWRHLS